MPKKGEIKKRIGEKFITLQGYNIEIIGYSGRKECTIQFEDGLILKDLRYAHIIDGYVKNPNHKSVHGVGYLGLGEHSACTNYTKSKAYISWGAMLGRCYSKDFLKRSPSYKDVTVCEEWHNFQNFAQWHEENWKDHMDSSWDLDKDILFKGNKIYSPETCCFVPQEINNLLCKANSIRGKYPIGVKKEGRRFEAKLYINNNPIHLGYFDTPEEAFQAYKTAKEAHIKEKADEWRPFIKPNVYEAMYNYQVEITD